MRRRTWSRTGRTAWPSIRRLPLLADRVLVIEWSAMPTVPPPYEPNPHYPTVGGSVIGRLGYADRRALLDGGQRPRDARHRRSGRCRLGAPRRGDRSSDTGPGRDVVRRPALPGSVARAGSQNSIRRPGGRPRLRSPRRRVISRSSSTDFRRRHRQTQASPSSFGPGAALAPYDVLWYVDLPKRFRRGGDRGGRWRNLGRSAVGRAGDDEAAVLHRLATARSASRRPSGRGSTAGSTAAPVDCRRPSIGRRCSRPWRRWRADRSGLGRRSTPRRGAATGGSAQLDMNPDAPQHRARVRADRTGERRPVR